jgi:hypothetical protein
VMLTVEWCMCRAKTHLALLAVEALNAFAILQVQCISNC